MMSLFCMGEREKVFVMAAVVVVVFVFAISFSNFDMRLTGYAVFSDVDEGNFDFGTYDNVEWNGSAVVLSADNLSGSYTSQVFDSGIEAGASWNSLSVVSGEPSVDRLYGVDGSGDVYSSVGGEDWDLVVDNYGRTTSTNDLFSDDVYLYLVAGSPKEVWRSDDGVIWEVVNDTFSTKDLKAGEVDLNGKLYVLNGEGVVFQSIDLGVTWITKGDFNAGAKNDAKGICVDSNNVLYVIDGSKDVFSSSNEGGDWTQVVDDYGGEDADDIACVGTDLFIVRDKHVWKSTDFGVTWIDINSDAFNDNSLRIDFVDGILYVLDVKGRVYNSTDGIIWNQIGDMNPRDNDPKGLTFMPESSILNFSVKSCDDSECSGESWVVVSDPDDLDVDDNRYFQYKVDFFSPDVSVNLSLEGVDVDYDLVNVIPSVFVDSPSEGLYVNGTLDLNYSVVDDNLDSCWYGIDGGENVSLSLCANISISVVDGAHELVVYVNDSFGEEISDSVEFSVDSNGVVVFVTEPVGEKDNRTGVALEYSIVGADECWYNVETSIGGVVIENTSLEDCNDSSFDVASDGDYVVTVFGNNSLDSFGFANSSFSVDTSEDVVVIIDSGTGGSGGSGGGSFGGGVLDADLEVSNISAIVSVGEEKSLVASVKNIGGVSANKCSLVSDMEIDSSDILNIGVGEIVEFPFVLSVAGFLDLSLSVVCLDNVSAEVPLDIVVLRPELDVSIDDISFKSKNELFVGYSIEPVDSRDDILYFRIIDSNGGILMEVSQDVSLVFGEVYSGDIVLDISDVNEGMLKVSVGDVDEVSFVEEDFIYEGGAGITGFVGMKVDGTSISIGVVVFLFLVAAGFIIFRIVKLKRVVKKKKK